MPSSASLASITLPTPGILPTGSTATNASTIAGLSTNWPSGLFQSLAILASNLLGAMPAEAVSRVSSRIASRMSVAIAVALPRSRFGAVTSR